MYKVDIQPEQKEAVAIEARRNREKQRQSRIFNVRNRVIGVDTEGLKSQVQEQRRRENAEWAREAALDASRVQCDLVAQMLEKEESQRARQVAKQVQAFREREQLPQDSRDFDLYDSASPQKENPVRAGDPDARCGPSSMQYFAGEDLGHPSHQRLQREQNRRELNRQREEHRQAKRDERYSELLADKKRVEMDLRAIHLEALEAACREAMDMAMANYNRAQAMEVEKQQHLARQREQDDNLTEIYNHLTSDLLTENTSASSQKVSGGWKGMSPEQVAAIHKEQAAQRLEAQHRRQTEQRLEAEWAFQEKLVTQAVCRLERAEKVKTQKLRQGLDAYNKQLAQEQQAQKDYLEKVVYTNEPTAHFHLQFNTSSR
ncbi:RIB43A-like with coiled-coils protein 1 [Monodelphis domestica]|uniref:RIB43A-like with coiled-coils protein 1 n=1 Tax=Monodelphis domestica TaxID=13616 RepID=H9H7Q0_MONDO|nr:RIB43A-like with coiled-coils protein 1 [Monodelphis domestica]XP_007506050.1 RIB43A-like with coiled-coils protein 1 [Monodelphis domestica]